ncbi:MAG: co-chaperone GroES [Oscillospiraceae bacterium]|nr:co-chaperone GroES [Oscillospiraceae bacterium]
MKLKPMADNLLLKQTEAQETTASGIILASAKEKPAIYEVISAGPEVKEIAAGNKVVVGNYIGSDIKLDGVDYKFVKLEDVLAIVTD